MRAGRLITLVLVLQRRGRVTAADLARELEVSERTVLRDIEALSGAGVPVYAVRGPGGGFQLLDGSTTSLPDPATWARGDHRAGRAVRAKVLLSPEGRRAAVLQGRLPPLRVLRTGTPPGAPAGWMAATFRVHTLEGAAADLLALGPHVEVLEPAALRTEVAERAARTAALYTADTAPRADGI